MCLQSHVSNLVEANNQYYHCDNAKLNIETEGVFSKDEFEGAPSFFTFSFLCIVFVLGWHMAASMLVLTTNTFDFLSYF